MLRVLNDRAALYALLRCGPLSRVELEQEIGLSKPAAAELLRRLEEARLVRRAGHRPTGAPGPNAQLWTVNEKAGYAVAADVTTFGVDVVIADLSGAVVAERKISTRRAGVDPAAAVRTAITDAARAHGLGLDELRRVVIGISGSIDPVTGFLEYATHMPRWHGFDLPTRLGEILSLPVAVENDVNLVAMDEVLHGTAAGYRDVILLWMSQGVAAAVVLGGRLHRGARGAAGEIDLAPVGANSTTASALLDSRGVAELARRHGIAASRGSVAVRRASAVASEDHERNPGDHDGFLAALADRIAQCMVGAVALLDPEVLILAGDIGLAGGDRLASRVTDRLHRMVGHRPTVRPGTGRPNAVRHGAMDAAIRQTREMIFSDALGPDDRDDSLMHYPVGQSSRRRSIHRKV